MALICDRVEPGLGFVISAIQRGAGGAITLTWNSEPGRSYQVQYAGALGLPGAWQDLPDAQTNAAPGQLTLSFTDSGGYPLTNRFFRIKLLP